ncbi:hypothetical protein GCM10010464_68280 [Pseudonocardia yunnanensis]|uniref:Uncharacterized protein n=1 Tax=Pseudonocardia yunnanensis TaxID=58107 RepID=A0ABW4EZ34_9PSEU
MNESMVVVVVIGIVALVTLGVVLGSHAGGPPGPKAATRRPEVAARSGRRRSSGDFSGIVVPGADGGSDCGWGGGDSGSGGDSGGGDGGGGSC